MKTDLAKSYLLFALGLLVFGIGISFGNKSLFGGNPMSVFVVGVKNHLNLSMGTCNLIVAAIEIIVGYLLDKSNVSIASVFGMICGSYAIDFGNLLISDSNNIYVRIIYMLVGIVCYCFGLAMQQYGHVGLGNLDCLNFGLKKAFKIKEYHTIKWIVDGMFLIAGYLLGGIVGIGTVLLLACSGLLIERFKALLIKCLGQNE